MLPRKRRSYSFISLILMMAGGGVFFSCADEDCFSVANNDLLVNFYFADTLENGKVILDEADTVFYTVKAAGNDSIYYDSTDVTSKFVLPVDPAKDLTTFEFVALDSITYVRDPLNGQRITDTIYYRNPTPQIMTISYQRKQRIISVECGTEIGYVNLELQETTFSNTDLINDRLSRLNEVNIEVYF